MQSSITKNLAADLDFLFCADGSCCTCAFAPRGIFCDNAYAIKPSIPRPNFQGDLLDSDGHGGQQYAPLMEIEIP